MANYLEQYQYQPIAPANTNIEQIAKTFQTKVAYWSQGAAQVKSAYQNYLGLSLTRSDNQQALSDYMKDAKTKLQTATMTDLSIGENVGKALDVFDPITNDRNIMGDHALTTKLSESIRKGESTASVNGGKDYSSKNVQYLRNKLNDFSQDKRRESWANYMASGTEYTPYTDTSKWLMESMKEFAPSEYMQQYVDNNGYIKTTEIMSRLPNDIRRHLMATMPDKVKRQLQIEGSVDFYGKEEILKVSYTDDYNNLIKANSTRIKEIDLLSINATKEKKDALLKEREELTGEIHQSTQILKDITEDPEYVKKNRDMFAGNTSLKQYVNAAASGLANEVKKIKVSPDYIWLGKNRMLMEQREGALERSLRKQIADNNNETSIQVALIGASSRKGTGTGKLASPIDDPNALPEPIAIKEENIGPEVQLYNDARADALSSANSFVSSLTVGQRDEYNKLSEDDKLKFFDEHFKDKTKAFNEAENVIAAKMKAYKAAGATNVTEADVRNKEYNMRGLTQFVKYKEALEEYTHIAAAHDKSEQYKENTVLANLPDKVTLDINDTFSDLKVDKKEYVKILNGESNQAKIQYYDGNKYVDVPRDKMKSVMKDYKDKLRTASESDISGGLSGIGNMLGDILAKHGIPNSADAKFYIKNNSGQWRNIHASDATLAIGIPYARNYQAKFKPKAGEFRTITAFEIKDDDEIKRLSASHNKSEDKAETAELKANPYTAFVRDEQGRVYGKRLVVGENGVRAYGIDRENILEVNAAYAFDTEDKLMPRFKSIKRTVELQAQETNYDHAIVYDNPITSPKKNSFKLTYERSPNGGAPTYILYQQARTPEEKQKAFKDGELTNHFQFRIFDSIYEVQQALTKL